MPMEQLLLSLADASPVAVVAIFSIWRLSVVMITLSSALVEIAKSQSANVTELVDKVE
jgi:hypothetical protein